METAILESRCRSGRKRILTLDGGDTRVFITLGILKALEDFLGRRYSKLSSFRLSQYFDLFCGTSLAALVATKLAQGSSVDDAAKSVREFCGSALRSQSSLGFTRPKYSLASAETALRKMFGDENIYSQSFQSLIAYLMVRLDTGSFWKITNFKRAAYWDSDILYGRSVRNLLLRELILASMSNPFWFTSGVTIEGFAKGGFADAATAGVHNPTLDVVQMAEHPKYLSEWRRSRDDLFCVSVGSGWWRPRLDQSRPSLIARNLRFALNAMDIGRKVGQREALTILQAVASATTPLYADDTLSDMDNPRTYKDKLFTFARFDLGLDEDHLKQIGLTPSAVDQLRKMTLWDARGLELAFAAGVATGLRAITDSSIPTSFCPSELLDPQAAGAPQEQDPAEAGPKPGMKIFISYKREDRNEAQEIADLLKYANYDVWYDADIDHGSNWSIEINSRIRSAALVIVLWSTRSIKSEWVLAEATAAHRSSKLLGVMLEPCDLPVPFNVLQCVDRVSHLPVVVARWAQFKAVAS